VKWKKILGVLKWVWITVVILAAGWYFYSRYQEISTYLGSLSIPRLVLSFFMLLAGKFLIADITRTSLEKIDHRVGFFDALTITYVTQLGKYLPGGVWHFAGKFGVYRLRGISTKKSTQALVLETVWLFSAAGLAGVTLLIASSRDLLCQYAVLLCDSFFMTAVAIGLPLVWAASLWLFEWLFLGKRKINRARFLWMIAKLVAIWIFFGVSYWLVFPAHSGFFLQITSAFSLGWLAGYIAIFAPGGIGIRELLLTVLLSSFFSAGEVAIYATIHRLLWVLAEILLGAGSALIFGMPVSTPEP